MIRIPAYIYRTPVPHRLAGSGWGGTGLQCVFVCGHSYHRVQEGNVGGGLCSAPVLVPGGAESVVHQGGGRYLSLYFTQADTRYMDLKISF